MKSDSGSKAIGTSTQGAEYLQLTFALTRQDIFRYNLYFSRGVTILAIIFAVAFVPSLLLALGRPHGDLGTFYLWLVIGIGLGILVCASVILAIYFQVYHIKSVIIERAMESRSYLISSAGLAVSTTTGQMTRTWADIPRVVETRHGVYLCTRDKAALIIPYHVVGGIERLAIFKRLLIESGTIKK